MRAEFETYSHQNNVKKSFCLFEIELTATAKQSFVNKYSNYFIFFTVQSNFYKNGG
jgi:hypothetical protein